MKRLRALSIQHGSTDIRHIRLFCAIYMSIFLFTQLFAFDAFPRLIQDATGVSVTTASIIAILLIAVELMALPFFLMMSISRTVILVSRVSGFVALSILTMLEIIALSSDYTLLFGAVFGLPSGAWSVLLLAAVWILTVWSSAGNAPDVKKPQTYRGFTITEVLVVIIVIAILSTVTIVIYGEVQRTARNTARLAELKQWVKIFDLYRVKHNKLPREGMPEIMLCLGRGFPELSDGKHHCRQQDPGEDTWFTATEETSIELMNMLEPISKFPPSDKRPAGGWLVGPWAEFRNSPGYGRQVLLSTAIDSTNPEDCTNAGFISSWTDSSSNVQICTSQNLYDV